MESDDKTASPRKRKTVTWRDEEKDGASLIDESMPIEVNNDVDLMCAVCGKPATLRENTRPSVLKRVATMVYDITGEVAKLVGNAFCSAQCQRKYYTFIMKRETEDIEDFKRRVFYMERLFENETMRAKYSLLDTHEIHRLCETLTDAYVSENKPSLMAIAKYHSVMLGGRGLVHVAGDNTRGSLGIGRSNGQMVMRMQPIEIEGVTSVYAAGRFTLLLRAESGTLLMSGRLAGMTFEGVARDDHFTPVPGMNDVIHVACNRHIICVVRRDGSLWTTNVDKDFLYFSELGTRDNDFVSVVVTESDILALRVDGTLWSSVATLNDIVQAINTPLVSIRCEPGSLVVARTRTHDTWVRAKNGVFHRITDAATTHASLVGTYQLVIRVTLPKSPLWIIEDGRYTSVLETKVQCYCSSENYDTLMYRRANGEVYARGMNNAGKLGLGITNNLVANTTRVRHLVPLRTIESHFVASKAKKLARAQKKQCCTTCGIDALYVVMGYTDQHFVCESSICLDSIYGM